MEEIEDSSEPIVVGIGASAGGLEALQAFVGGLPESGRMAYIVAQHLSPTHRSMLVELLGRSTKKKVVEVKNGSVIQQNIIYITPENKDLYIEGNTLYLKTVEKVVGPRPNVNYFFTSLAEAKKNRAVGVILSGTGSDGSHGIRAIKAEGGITIAQDPETAKYDGMPVSAIQTGNVDLILAPEQMGSELVEVLEYPGVISLINQVRSSPDYLDTIFRKLFDYRNVDFSRYKLSTINRRIERRMSTLKLSGIKDYVDYIEAKPDEINLLYKDILIGVTAFFRDPESFQTLRDYLERHLAQKQKGDSIRAWIIGCSTGEEPYTIAIILMEILGARINEFDVQIFATDIDESAIQFARKAMYPETSLVHVDPELVEKYFILRGDYYELIKPVREKVIFSRHNVLRDSPFLRLDLISCRNLLIYFNQDLQKQVLPVLHYSLNEGGLLYLGKSESIGHFYDLFTGLDKKAKIFRSQYAGVREVPRFVHFNPKKFELPEKIHSRSRKENREETLESRLSETVADYLLGRCIVLNEANDVVYVRGSMPYLSVAQGRVTFNVFKMLHEDLGLELRTALHRIGKGDAVVVTRYQKIRIDEAQDSIVRMVVLKMPGGETPMVAVFFQTEEEEALSPFMANVEGGSHESSEALRNELNRTRDQLQNVIEELETSYEEMQSLNEELQSSNEELETTNEELQSTNEELQTAYAEMKVLYEDRDRKANYLEKAKESLELRTGDLERQKKLTETIFETVPIAITMVDRKGKIVFSNSRAASLLDIRPGLKDDYLFSGQNSQNSDLEGMPLPEDKLPFTIIRSTQEPVRDVRQSIVRNSKKVMISVSGAPLFNEEGLFSGAVFAIDDITEKILTEKELIQSRNELADHKTRLEEKVRSEVARYREQEQMLLQQSRLAATGEMLGAIAHQWRQPLNSLGLFVQDLQDAQENGELTPEYLDATVKEVMEQIGYMSETIDDFRNFFRPGNSLQEVRPMEVVRDTIRLLGAQLNAHGIQFDITDTSDERARVSVNANQFRQAIINILTNARDAIQQARTEGLIPPDGSGIIRIHSWSEENKTGLSFWNNGGEAGPVVLERMFDPYFTTKQENKGTGLGLYVARIIIEKNMHGSIRSEDMEGGVQFMIYLPVVG